MARVWRGPGSARLLWMSPREMETLRTKGKAEQHKVVSFGMWAGEVERKLWAEPALSPHYLFTCLSEPGEEPRHPTPPESGT